MVKYIGVNLLSFLVETSAFPESSKFIHPACYKDANHGRFFDEVNKKKVKENPMFKIERIDEPTLYEMICGYCGCSNPTTRIDRYLINKWICTHCTEQIYDYVYKKITAKHKNKN